ncbi:MAG: hypothetical protein HY548_08260 [Elusimicrobia bacterium]|nr:hypothetical protein [Elusimicrobiota bacterium]
MRKPPKLTKKKLDRFLASICEAAGMTGKSSKRNTHTSKDGRVVCRAPCGDADWRAHLDIPAGILCVSAAWSSNKKAEKHRDVTVAVTFLDEHEKPQYTDMVFCDSEVRWLMETLWHAPIWE